MKTKKLLVMIVTMAALLVPSLTGVFAYGGYVRATDKVNLRTGPGLTYASVTVMWRGDTADYLGDTSRDVRGVNWYHVNYAGKIGWVSSRYSTLYGNYYTSYGNVAYVSGNTNLRKGPGLTYGKVGMMFKGDHATYLGQSSVDSRGVTWYYVNYAGLYGWISSRYATLNGYYDRGYNNDNYSRGYTYNYGYVYATAKTNIRTGAGLTYSKVAMMFRGDYATYLGQSRVDSRGVTWYYVNYAGKIGWVSSRYTTF